jgi:hypothetical protein
LKTRSNALRFDIPKLKRSDVEEQFNDCLERQLSKKKETCTGDMVSNWSYMNWKKLAKTTESSIARPTVSSAVRGKSL